jgi:EmrB/QacA subfamily drug resistance transporter
VRGGLEFPPDLIVSPGSTSPRAVVVPAATGDSGTYERRWRVFAVIVVGAFMAQLDLFIVNIAFPAIARSFPGVSASTLSWVLDAYAIVFAACLVPAGRLGDRLGRRRVFELGLAGFALGSAGCAAAPNVGVLVAARVVQAIGAALVLPTSLGLLLHAFPPEQRAGAVGAWASAGAIAAASGPPLGGLLVGIDWRLIFVVNLPLALGAIIASRRVVPEVRHPDTGGRPDLPGIVLLIAGIGGVVLCIVQGAEWGWGSAAFVIGLLVAFALIAVFLWRCAHHPAPIVELSLLRLRPFAVANAAMLVFYIGFGAMLLGSVLFLTGVWHESTIIAGLSIAPGPLCVAFISPRVKDLVGRIGPQPVAVLGGVAFAAGGMWWRWRIGPQPDYAADFLPGMILAGIGVGLMQATLYGVASGVLPPNRFATGSGVLNMSRQIGLALGVAILVAILGANPGLAAFHTGFSLLAGTGLAAALIALKLSHRSLPARATRSDGAPIAAVADSAPSSVAVLMGAPAPAGAPTGCAPKARQKLTEPCSDNHL